MISVIGAQFTFEILSRHFYSEIIREFNSSKSLYMEKKKCFLQIVILSFQWNPTGDEETAWQMSFLAMNLTPLGVLGVPDTTNEIAQLPCHHPCWSVLWMLVGLYVQVRKWACESAYLVILLYGFFSLQPLCILITHACLINSCHGRVAHHLCCHHP